MSGPVTLPAIVGLLVVLLIKGDVLQAILEAGGSTNFIGTTMNHLLHHLEKATSHSYGVSLAVWNHTVLPAT